MSKLINFKTSNLQFWRIKIKNIIEKIKKVRKAISISINSWLFLGFNITFTGSLNTDSYTQFRVFQENFTFQLPII